jgi:tripartite-type tricarboxylate transporter receptor subunit TctC
MKRRQYLGGVMAGLTGLGFGPASLAQTAYPNRPIKLICPLAAGGGADVAARTIGDYIAQKLKQPVIVDNRVGAGTQIGTEAAVKAAPDGYTLYLLPGDIAAIDKAFGVPLPYDVQKDLTLVSGVASIPLVLVASVELKAKTLGEVVKKAKDVPGSLTFGSLGSSSPHYLFFEWFKQRAGIRLNDVPYKSTAQAATDLIGGRIDLSMMGEVNAANQAKAGRLVPIATTAAKRSKTQPEVATFAESYPELVMNNWYALAVPAGTPASIVETLYRVSEEALSQDAVAARMSTIGLSPWAKGPADLTAWLGSEVDHYAKVIRDSGARHESR